MTQITRNGIVVDVPTGWEAELVEHPGRRIVLHMANSPLPIGRSDFGGHAIENLPKGRAFVSLLEYDPRDANKGLFQSKALPAFVPGEFAANKMHRLVWGQNAAQRFFSIYDRAFCCYAVIASDPVAIADVAAINRAIQRISVTSFQ